MVKIVGILNVTLDSFSDGNCFLSVRKALNHADKLFKDGASMIDIGAESTNPKSLDISPDLEWERLLPLLPSLLKKFPQKISLDSRNPQTVKKFLDLGGTIINDVSGFRLKEMTELAIEYDAECIVNHFPGETIKSVHSQKIESVQLIFDDLMIRSESMIFQGVSKSKIILDPGIGFGKTMDCNWKLLSFGQLVPDFRVMIGHSKKRFLGDSRFEKEINLEAGKIAIEHQASYLRVHNPEWYRNINY